MKKKYIPRRIVAILAKENLAFDLILTLRGF